MNDVNLLSIGGSDPSAGAGIQSDIKTFSKFNAHGLTVVTAITGQNTSNFGMVRSLQFVQFNNLTISTYTKYIFPFTMT